MRFKIWIGEKSFKNVKPKLEALYKKSKNANPFIHPEWIYPWWEIYGGSRTPVILSIEDENEDLILASAFTSVPGIAATGLWPMGYQTIDYVDPICNQSIDDVRGAFEDGLEALLNVFPFIWLPLVREKLYQSFFLPFLEHDSVHSICRGAATRSLIKLPEDNVDKFIKKKLGTKNNTTLRYRERKLKEFGNIEYSIYQTKDEVSKIIPEIKKIENKSWKNDAGVGLFSLTGTPEFYNDALPLMAEAGRVMISTLTADGTVIAYELAFLQDDTYCMHNLAYDPAFQKGSPGRYLMVKNIKTAVNKGFKVFDFMQGTQEYKEDFLTHKEPIKEISLFKKSMKGYINYKVISFVQNKRKQKAAKK